MQLKDFLRKIAETGKIVNTDYNALLSASGIADPALEVPDDFFTKFNETFITRERAENDDQIVTAIQRATHLRLLNKVDDLMEPLYALIPADEAKEIGKAKVPLTFERMELLDKALKKAFKNATVKNSTDVQKVEDEWSGKLKATEEKHKLEQTQLIAQHKEDRINAALKTKLAGYRISDTFKPAQEPIMQIAVSKVKGFKHNGNPGVLSFDDDGNLILQQSVDGTLRDIYVKEEKLSLDKLLDQEMEPFIVKSNGNAPPPPDGNQTPEPIDTRGKTLHELMQLQAVKA